MRGFTSVPTVFSDGGGPRPGLHYPGLENARSLPCDPKIFPGKIRILLRNENRIAIDPDQVFKRDRDRDSDLGIGIRFKIKFAILFSDQKR